MPEQHSLAQLRAQHALAAIEALARMPAPTYGNYVSYAKALPANIRSLGLGQAMAFLLAKAEGSFEKPHGILYRHVAEWLGARSIYGGTDPAREFMANLTRGDQENYLRAQIETMAYLEWLKKFAVALLDKPEREDDA